MLTGHRLQGRGVATPLGLTRLANGKHNFAVFIDAAQAVSLRIYPARDPDQPCDLALNPVLNRTGDVWHACILGLSTGDLYTVVVTREGDDTELELADPFARSPLGRFPWNADNDAGIAYTRCVVDDHDYDWEDDSFPRHAQDELIIYELAVRWFTADPSSQTEAPGTFSALQEKIPYLRWLGINAVELLPIAEFDERDPAFARRESETELLNHWGYQPLNFFAPKRGLSQGDATREFRDLVKALHRAGIEIILDVVFNHTGESDADGPVLSFRGLADDVYYQKDPEGALLNHSGCGNTFSCNSAVGLELIISALRHWVTELHVDGFRFDLASILTRDHDGAVIEAAPIIRAISEDPVLAQTRLIAEPWDASGLYQLGGFGYRARWQEWNARFRDDVRDFVRARPGMLGALAARLTGSLDVFEPPRGSCGAINFITAHDGFTLRDLVSYNEKHNEANGEQGRDGENENRSWNCGQEGESEDPDIIDLRIRQMKNFLLILFLSRGTPMLLAGDERGRTQGGNNNAYCQDNAISWLNWSANRYDLALRAFVQELIAFRKANPIINRADGETIRRDYIWHGYRLNQAHWGEDAHWLGMHIKGSIDSIAQDEIYLLLNNDDAAREFELPDGRWAVVFDTFSDTHKEKAVTQQYAVEGKSSVVLLRRAAAAQ